ncbi:MAG: SpoIIE family protein phosphatase [Acidobacteriota bacterium]
MNLRLRLIVAFFLLSVVPLGAVTLFTYTSNVAAMRQAARHESELLAGELTQRMDLVTEQLSARVAHLMEVQRDAVATTGVRAAATTPRPAAPAPPMPPAQVAEAAAAASAEKPSDTVAEALGEVAMLLNNIEVRGMRGPGDRRGGGAQGPGPDGRGGGRGFGGGRGPRGDAPAAAPSAPSAPIAPGVTLALPSPPPLPGAAPVPALPAAPVAGGATVPTPPSAGISPGTIRPDFGAPPSGRDPSRGNPQDRGFSVRFPSDPTRPGPPPDRYFPRGATPDGAADRGGPPPVPGAPPAVPGADEKDRIMFDMMPIRREIMQQLVGSGEQWEKLTPEERGRIVAEVNQRMLGIVQGIQLGAAEVQKKVVEAQKAAGEKARDAPSPAASAKSKPRQPANQPAPATAQAARGASTAAPTAGPTRRRTALSGSRLDVTVERNGEVVRRANAEVNMPNLLATVFTTTRRDRGEVPFAIGKDGRLYTPTEEDRKQVEAINNGIVKQDTPPGTTVTPDWIVVTTADPNGSGLRFGIARPVGASLDQLRRTSVRNAGVGLGFIGLALIGIVPLSSRLTRHLSTLSDGVNRIAQGDYSARVKVGANDEIGRLARAFNRMAEDVEQHQRDAVKQERIRRELELGRQIQADMLPQGPLRVGATEIKGVSVPAREVGGDFFNYFTLLDWKIALLVGDVSGKGVGAALLMANIQASLRTRLALGQDLAAIAREIDVDVEGNTPGPVYATLFMGILDPVTRELTYVNAGHNPQYVIRKDGRLEHMSSSGLPIGLLAGRGYSETRVQLDPGDLIFCYTDGCVETENEAEEMFGAERLESLLLASAGAEDLLTRVESVIAEFRGTREAFDDATMMVVKIG